MQTRITARHFKAETSLQEYTLMSVSKLEKFFDGITEARVVLDVDESPAGEKLAEISVKVYRKTLAARDTAPTHREAVNRCVESLRRQVLKYKNRLRDRRKERMKAA